MLDPKATLSYVVARSAHEAATIAPADSVSRAITAHFTLGHNAAESLSPDA